ncbi:hypothetical protein [Streptomyces sp. NPDC093094]|uniref:hypothetical protein n=1 Tax=Streptomyces sp. NPDC093094 TaxID=3366026 RepID=UPI003820A2E3
MTASCVRVAPDGRHRTYQPRPAGRHRTTADELEEPWRRRYPHFPRLLFILDGTGSAGVENRISALHATRNLNVADFLREVQAMPTAMTDLLQHGPSAPV